MKLQVIMGSTRPGRVADRVTKWIEAELKQLDGVEYEVLDLRDYDLPHLEEPISPRYNPDRKPEGDLKRWLEKLAEADGYVMVTPEYNRSTSGVLKNAIDVVDFQMDNKPVALVAYGSTGGAQAVANLRNAIPGVNAMTVPTVTYLVGFMDKLFNEDGTARGDVSYQQGALQGTLKSLAWYAGALKAARK